MYDVGEGMVEEKQSDKCKLNPEKNSLQSWMQQGVMCLHDTASMLAYSAIVNTNIC